MKLFYNRIKLIILFLLFLVSCAPSPTLSSNSVILPDNINSSQPNLIPLTPIVNSSSPEVTQVEFLVDNSGSVVGDEINPKGCKEISRGNKKDVRFDFIAYIKGVLNRTVPDDLMPYLLLGMGVFGKGEEYDSLDWDSPQIPFTQDDQTYYVTGIRNAINNMYKEPDVQRRILVIVTDGAFTSESVEEVQTELQNQSNIHKDLSIYVTLLCPEESSLIGDVVNWGKQINILDNVDVYYSLEDVTKKIFDELTLQKFLPFNNRSIIIDPNEDQVLIPGYATTTIFSYWSSDAANIFTLQNQSTQESKSLSPGMEGSFINQPEAKCAEHKYIFSNSHSSIGILFIKLQTFQNLRLLIDPLNENGRIEVVNFSPVSFELNIFDEQSDNFGEWNDCFTVGLASQNEVLLDFEDQQLCGANGNLCRSDDKNAQIKLKWHPSKIFEPSVDINSVGIKVNLIPLSEKALVWESSVINVPIMFQPLIDYNPPQIGNTQTSTDRIDRYFSFNNVVDPPRIYLISNLKSESFDAVGRTLPNGEACPSVTTLVNSQLASEVNRNVCPPTLSLDGNKILTNMCVMPELNLLRYNYNITTYQYSIQECGFENIIFTWQELRQTKAITWNCDLLGNFGCKEEAAPIIRSFSIP